ncbi:MAG: hypothetical protein HUU22_05530 [Phycisphaerae bacterium]|nr:hypothetical protein [Phycisphaerae bacterium]NUQ45475.1 hypothetical protein [Phycisphaerae bacterium]
MEFRLYDHPAGAPGAVLFSETHPIVVVEQGLFSVAIGSLTPGGVPDAAFDAAEIHLGITVNGGAELAPRTVVGTTPFALKSRSAEQLVVPNSFAPAVVVAPDGKVGVGTAAPNAEFSVVGDATATGTMSAGSGIIGGTFDASAINVKGRPVLFTTDASSVLLVEAEADRLKIRDTLDATAINLKGRPLAFSSDATAVQMEIDQVTVRDTADVTQLQIKGATVIGTTDPTFIWITADSATLRGSVDATEIQVSGRTLARSPDGTSIHIQIDEAQVRNTVDVTHIMLNGQTLASGLDPSVISVFADDATVRGTLSASSVVMPQGSLDASGGQILVPGGFIVAQGGFIIGPTTVNGDLHVQGTLTAANKLFVIAHPLDPEHKYLAHAAVESDEMKNIYDGMAVLDEEGEAVVVLPDWFEALNGEFRYHLTCVGAWAPVYVAREIRDHRFVIAGGTPGLKVCWQVTGVRRDDYARRHPLAVESPRRPAGTTDGR